jgi:hypothetical protein
MFRRTFDNRSEREGSRADGYVRTRWVPGSAVGRAPAREVVGAIAIAGFVAGGASFALALTSDHVHEPGLQAALMNWVALPY